MKKLILILFILSSIFLLGCISKPAIDTNDLTTDLNEPIIGGTKDEFGCLVGTGYSYDVNIGACARVWEMNENVKEAAKVAVDFVNTSDLLYVGEITVIKCPGCFEVELSKMGEESFTIQINSWIPKYKEKNNRNQFFVKYDSDKNLLNYKMVLMAPRACDSFKVTNELILKSNPVQIIVEVEPLLANMVCAQVLTPVELKGSIEIDHVPASFSVKLVDEIIYSTNEIKLISKDLNEPIYCTENEKNSEVCTFLYAPICGDNNKTYGNACVGCSSKEIEYYFEGEC